MGIVRTVERRKAELEEFQRMLRTFHRKPEEVRIASSTEDKVVCITSGISFLGLWIANELLVKGYSVRLAVENEEDLLKLREMEVFTGTRSDVVAVMANVMEIDSLCEAFNGCRGVFHTSAFVDPGGISGYSKHMVNLEAKAAENVIEACARTPSVRKCVFTSSLLACVWREVSGPSGSVLDEKCWSEERVCQEKKLWFALGKTMGEKAGWRKAREREVNMVSICPGLITGPSFHLRNSTWSMAYLKGAREMYEKGVLASVDVSMAAEAHVYLYENMEYGACGRYICFDRVIIRAEEAIDLQEKMAVTILREGEGDSLALPVLSNSKLSRLMSSSFQRCSQFSESL
ncbi:hypothetical protein AMTRI_Chr01g112450 [Amborella trichopoda]|uniref:3-beta hydroxysteroid dehydrogenase/isomerase domain-containing protein n=1 Tax=Amborella trichopoda TaxID=13333 RepID=W1P9X2_AMBTC|nr:cinnamoyl-CoA reductase-like SNL6 [Amborella trichopoda]ERN06677.1 hypothetical protein AMTR_s00058p00200980 [Amborella trichopoda]|eukprot:XP_006845002.1 cinnamoyl-CoA reductase-like SNL6 [Amborella trichopoda]